jgi:hypothetical protein
MGETPAQPVVGYVGYALKEPWGQPRAVIGFSAEEAERLAEFLEGGSRDLGHVEASPESGRPMVPEQPAEPHLSEVTPVSGQLPGTPPAEELAAESDILAVTSQLPGSQRQHSFLPGIGARLKLSRFGTARPRSEPGLTG